MSQTSERTPHGHQADSRKPIGKEAVPNTIAQLLPGFGTYMTVERKLAPKTITNYSEAIRYFLKQMGDVSFLELSIKDFLEFKGKMASRGAGESRVAGIINAMKCLLSYAKDVLELPVMDPTRLKVPKVPRREVVYLTPEELNSFIENIPLNTWKGTARHSGYCLRALVELLLATGMRISEALALNRNSVDWKRKEAMVIGKGNKQRTVYFSDRSLGWLDRYLHLRCDANPALFITARNTRLNVDGAQALFQRATSWAGLEKRVTPHVLRHTAATNLLRKGCPIGFIKEILGHDRLETTCRYYLGIMEKSQVKRIHSQFVDSDADVVEDSDTADPGLPPLTMRGNGVH